MFVASVHGRVCHRSHVTQTPSLYESVKSDLPSNVGHVACTPPARNASKLHPSTTQTIHIYYVTRVAEERQYMRALQSSALAQVGPMLPRLLVPKHTPSIA
jgi:hypothetical protein